MYTLSEIKDIRKKYRINENGDIELTGKEKVKAPSEMTEEEKSYIESALFLYRKVRLERQGIAGGESEEGFLEEMQEGFTSEVLKTREYTRSMMGITQRPSELVWASILMEEPGAMSYFNRVLAENGKKVQNYQRETITGLSITIKYDLIDDSKGKFQQSLNPNNPMYTQNPKPVQLKPEQIERRRKFVDKLMQVYRQCEKDENYQDRVAREDKDMAFVVKTINSSTTIERIPEPKIVRIMDLLYAAQNVSLNGERDYLGAILDQPMISEILLQMRDDKILDKMSKKAQERKDNGTITSHKPTHGEISIRDANEFISEHPNAVEVARKKLNEQSSFTIDKGNIDRLKKARLIEIVARTQGKSITRTKDENGNRILQVSEGKEQLK